MRTTDWVDSTIEELRTSYEAKRLVIVAGPGISAAAGVPSRVDVARRLVERVRVDKRAEPERIAEIESLVERGRTKEAFGELEEILTFATLGAEVERLWYAEDKPIPEIASVIAALAPKLSAIVSLSLDRVLPRALAGRWHTFARVLDDLGQRAARHAFLLQLHGTLFERETWVLTAQQAADASFNRPSRRDVLASFLRTHTLLFVGCDTESGDLDPLLDAMGGMTPAGTTGGAGGSGAVQPPRHFALVPSGSLGPWRQHRLRGLGIEVVPFEEPRSGTRDASAAAGASTAVGGGTASVAVRAGGKDGGLDGAVEVLAAIGGLSLPLPSASGEAAGEVSLAGEPECPFPGLACFEEADEPYFFGRDHDVDDAVSRLGGAAGVRWLQIEGASGTGKSSFVRAGLVPAIRKRGVDGGPETWTVAVLRPGNEPLVALANAVRGLAGDDAPPLDELCARLEKPAGLTTFLREHLDERVQGERRGLLLVIDQLEEAVTLGGEERATITAAFDAALARALRDTDGPLHLVTTIRSDQVGRLEAGLPQLAALLNSSAARYTLRAMGGAALRAAIEAPARKAGLAWEGDLAARVLEDAGGTSSGLPLVAHVLRALFDHREGRTLTLAAYDTLGGVAGALTKSADDVLAPLDAAGRDRARKMLLRLVKIGRGTNDSRQPAPRAEVLEAAGDGAEIGNHAEMDAVLDRLAGSRDLGGGGSSPVRLVVVGADEDGQRVDLVHEALLRKWKTLADWIEAHRKALEKRDDLEHQAQAWVAAGRSNSGLATGAQLAYLRGAEAPNERARVFLEKSEKRDKRQRRLQTMGFVGATAAAILMAALAWRANAKSNEANRRLGDAIETADYVTFEIDRKLAPIAGAAAVRKELLQKTAELQEKLIAGAPDSAEALRSREATHSQRGDLALSHDNLALARQEYEAGLVLAQRLAAADPSNAALQRDLSVSFNKLGDVLQAGGDLKAARDAFEKDLELTKALAAADPSNAALQRDLSVSYERLGGVLQAGGDLKAARDAFEKSLDVIKALAAADPSNAALQRDLSVSFNRLGDVLKAVGDLKAARDAFEKSLDVIKALAAADPSNAALQRDLSVSYERLGGVLQAGGDLKAARDAFEKSLDLRKALAAADPSNAALQRDLSVSYDRLGDVLKAGGDLKAARDAFEKDLELTKALAAADPSNAALQRDLSVSYERLGDVLKAGGDLKAARDAFEKALDVIKALAAADPSNAALQRDLSVSFNRLGDVLKAGGDLKAARDAFEKALDLRKALAAADPSNGEWQLDLAISHIHLIALAQEAKDTASRQKHTAAARAIVDSIDRSGRMQGYALLAQTKAYLESLPPDPCPLPPCPLGSPPHLREHPPMPDWLDQDLWTDLRDTFERRQLVVFAGAGISVAGGLPLWPALTAQIVERLRAAGKGDAADEAQHSLERGRLVEALSAAQHALGPVPFGDALARSLDDRGKPVPELARAIAALRDKLHGVVTTNLDRFLERAGEGEWLETVKPVGDLGQQSGFLWKAHGTLQDRSTWVFARAAYDRVMFGDPQYRATFAALYRTRTFLFVGCSLTDDDLDFTLGEARALSAEQPPTHFALLEGPIATYRRRTLEQAGIRILAYPKGQHDEITRLLRALGAGGWPGSTGASVATGGVPPNSAVGSPATPPGATGTLGGAPPFPAPVAPPRLLSETLLREIHGAVLSAGLSRSVLLASLDRRLASGLRTAPSTSEQIWEDLTALNAIDALPDGSVPLRTWLETAAHLAYPRREAATFQKAIQALKAP